MNVIKKTRFYLESRGQRVLEGFLPHAPDRLCALQGKIVRPEGDEKGSEMRLILRTEQGGDPIAWASELLDIITRARGEMTPDGPCVYRALGEISPLPPDNKLRPGAQLDFTIWI